MQGDKQGGLEAPGRGSGGRSSSSGDKRGSLSMPPSGKRKGSSKAKVASGLSDVTAMQAVRFGGFVRDEAGFRPARMLVTSFKEARALELVGAVQPSWLAHNRLMCSRVYPMGSRINSSNPGARDACRLWGAGVQMVALNFQTHDAAMMASEALFSLNGKCGYVLQPPLLDASATRLAAPGQLLTLRLLSAHNLPKARDERCVPEACDEFHPRGGFAQPALSAADVVSPMCEVEIVGGRVGPGTHNTSVGGVEPHWERMLGLEQIDPCTSPLVSERWRQLSSTVSDNGLNPCWGGERFACAVWTPQQAMLKVSVYNSKKQMLGKGSRELLAYAMLPFGALRNGYRSVQLRSRNGCVIDACSLFVHIQTKPLEPSAEPRAAPPPADGPAHDASERRESETTAAWSTVRLSVLSLASFTGARRRNTKESHDLSRLSDVAEGKRRCSSARGHPHAPHHVPECDTVAELSVEFSSVEGVQGAGPKSAGRRPTLTEVSVPVEPSAQPSAPSAQPSAPPPVKPAGGVARNYKLNLQSLTTEKSP